MRLRAEFVLDRHPDITGPVEYELSVGADTASSVADVHGVDDVVTVAMLMPALVDASVRFRGYRESLTETPFGAAAHIDDLHRRYGIGACKESGNSWEALRHALDVLGVTGMAPSGPVLVDGEPEHEVERPIVGSDGAVRAIDSLVCEGARWTMVGSSLRPGQVRDVAAAASRRAVRLAGRVGATDLEGLLDAGVEVVHGAATLVSTIRTSGGAPSDTALAWADVDPDVLAERVGAVFVGHDAVLVPEYVATRRRVLLEEAIDAFALDELVPILPAARYLIEMRRAGGKTIGRQQMSNHAGMTALKRRDRARARDGLDRLGGFVAALSRGGVRLWPGSASPSVGVVPGAGLWEELAALASVGVDVTGLLWSASTGAAEHLGRESHDVGLFGAGGAVALGADPRVDAGGAFRSVVPVVVRESVTTLASTAEV